MQLSEDSTDKTYLISNFSATELVLNSTTTIKTSCCITPTKVETDLPISNLEQFNQQLFDKIVGYRPEVLIIGTGNTHLWLEKSWSQRLLQAGIGFETMRNDSAMRTYNILASESRKVLLLLIF